MTVQGSARGFTPRPVDLARYFSSSQRLYADFLGIQAKGVRLPGLHFQANLSIPQSLTVYENATSTHETYEKWLQWAIHSSTCIEANDDFLPTEQVIVTATSSPSVKSEWLSTQDSSAWPSLIGPPSAGRHSATADPR